MKTIEEYLAITGPMMSYTQAATLGARHFWKFDIVEGKPIPRACAKGHVAPYYTENRVCFECNRITVNRHNAAKRASRDAR